MMRSGFFACALALAGLCAAGPARAQGAPPLMYSQALAPGAARLVQERLAAQGFFHGRPDGAWDEVSASALSNFQQTHGLQPNGVMNEATAIVLGLSPATLLAAAAPPAPTPLALAPPVASTTLSVASVEILQSRLRQLGYYDGAIDGAWGPEAEGALTRFQQASGLPPSGRINPQTVSAMGLDPNALTAAANP